MYKKVSTDMNFMQREKEILKFWKDNDIRNRSIRTERDAVRTFTLYDGPPTANGKPHFGHIKTRVIKDVIPRFHGMKGARVEFKAGWDTHGLPVELEVEKMLGINGKPEIEKYGVEPFIKKCKESVWKYLDEWEQMSARVGFWADMEHPYVTYENNYIESEWWALKTMWDKGMLYKGHKIVPYCPRCGTSLSSHEVAQGYRSVKENSVFVRFAVANETDTYFASWTTTPWTLPSNVGLSVNPDEEYVLISVPSDTDGTEKTARYYMAGVLAPVLFEEYSVEKRMEGKELVGMRYEPLFPYANQAVAASGKSAFRVTADDYVTMNDGTGIVHIAPAFGEDDARVGLAYDLPFVQLVREDGTLPEEAEEFAGMFVKDADPLLIKKLNSEGKMIKKMPYEHDYPFCWRCDTALIYYARTSWFIAMTKVKDALIASNRSVNWYPESIRDGRMGNFLENVVDWGISRERYWGTPLPVWECECGHRHCIGSIDELKSMSPDCPDDIELHKPYVDHVHIRCDKCGAWMTRVPEVIDCWFDSGAMPFAQYHYPFENKEFFEKHFPSDFISEALDQTRGWFYSLLAIGTQLFGKSPFENCIVMGLVQDKDGIKMSKHKGNVVDPWDILNKQGADAARWYFCSASAPWLPSRFSDAAVSEIQRKFMGTLWNTYAFYVMYANIDEFDPSGKSIADCDLTVMDRWIMSRLNTLIAQVDEKMTDYDITGSSRLMEAFVDELSNWYVRRCRDRYWGSEMTDDKLSAYMTLYTVLEQFIRLAAPFVPFMTEAVYQNLIRSTDPDAPLSVHLCDFPTSNASYIDKELEKMMDTAQQIVFLGRACRNQAAIKNRQPLSKLYAVSPVELSEEYLDIIREELNVRSVVFLKDSAELVDYSFKPQLRTLGKRLGAKMSRARDIICALPGKATLTELEEKGFVTISIDDEAFELSKDDLLIETAQPEGLSTQSERDYTVSLDTTLTEELIEEGFVREIISKVQTHRKESGYDVTDRIILRYDGNDEIARIIGRNKDFIASEVLATEVAPGTEGDSKEWDINGQKCTFSTVRKTGDTHD
ncbi:MAG: isoleucine--tRNA ligase [Clostridiales bacterium]|nr:isoleucine--tRNA ligase [Clostridiales bacterium]